MNLNYDQSPETLIQLLATADTNLPAHNIAVDYDGEVIVDPEVQYPHIEVSKFPFRVQIANAAIRSSQKIKEVHALLMDVLNNAPSMGQNEYRIAA